MATFNFTKGGVKGVAHDKVGKQVVLEREIDFANAKYAGVGAGDVVQVLNLPAGFFMEKSIIKVITAAGGISVADIGDATDPNGFDAAVDLNVVGTSQSISTDAYPVLGGKHYAVADTLDLVISADPLIAKVKVYAVGYMIL
jgi:hypothetical protein